MKEFAHLCIRLGQSKALRRNGGGRSNPYKTIVEQGLEVGLGYYANVPMTIGKSQFEGGVATCAHKWKTADIYQRKPAGRLHT